MNRITIKLKQPVGVLQKRKARDEYQKIKSWYDIVVSTIETEFIQTINNSGSNPISSDHPYSDIYDAFNERFLDSRTEDLKGEFFQVDMYYFERLYRALEKER